MRFPIRFVPDQPNINFVGHHMIIFVVCAIATLASIGLLTTRGLNFGIDFTGGIVIEARLPAAPNMAAIRGEMDKLNVGEVALQQFGEANDILIRLGHQGDDEASRNAAIERVKAVLNALAGEQVEYRKVDFVGPQVGEELMVSGLLALILSIIGIMAYVWFRFEWQFSIGVVIGLVLDAIWTVAFFSLMQLEFNLTSIAALLTTVGYSVNDKVVIYDRVREYLRKYRKMPMPEILNASLNSTLSRAILTHVTTFLAILALVEFGGQGMYSFSVAMLFGICVGVFSSIYVSAPALLYLNLRRDAKAKTPLTA